MSLADGVEWLQAKHAQELLDAVKKDPPVAHPHLHPTASNASPDPDPDPDPPGSSQLLTRIINRTCACASLPRHHDRHARRGNDRLSGGPKVDRQTCEALVGSDRARELFFCRTDPSIQLARPRGRSRSRAGHARGP